MADYKDPQKAPSSPAAPTSTATTTPSAPSSTGWGNAAEQDATKRAMAASAIAADSPGPYGSVLDLTTDEVAMESAFASDPATTTGTPTTSPGGPLKAAPPPPETDAPTAPIDSDQVESTFTADPGAGGATSSPADPSASSVEDGIAAVILGSREPAPKAVSDDADGTQPTAIYPEAPVYFLGTTTPVPTATGIKTRKDGERTTPGGSYFDPSTDTLVDFGATTSSSSTDDQGVTTTTSRQATTKTSAAGVQATSNETVTAVADDPVATATRLKQTIDAQATTAEADAERLNARAWNEGAQALDATDRRDTARENVRVQIRKSAVTTPSDAAIDAAAAADPAWQAADQEVRQHEAEAAELNKQAQQQRDLATRLRTTSAKVPTDGSATMEGLAPIAHEAGVLVEPATSTSRTKTSTTPTTDFNFLDGGVSSNETTRVETLNGATTESTTSALGEIGNGRLYAGSGWSTSVKDGTGQLHPDGPTPDDPNRADGTGQETASASMSGTGGLVVKSDDEMGVGGEFKAAAGDTERAANVVAGGEVTNKGVYGHLGTTLESGSNNPLIANDSAVADTWTTPKFTVLLDGMATISAKPDGEGHIDVVTTIRAGGTIGFEDGVAGKAVGGSDGGEGSFAAGISVTGKGEAVFTHRMTPTEYDAYETELKQLRETPTGAGATEIGLLSRLRYAPDPEQLLATHSSALAADLPVGDSMATSMTVGGSAYARMNATGTQGKLEGTKGAPGAPPTGALDEGDQLGVSGAASFGAKYVSQVKVEKRSGPNGDRVYLTSTLTPSTDYDVSGGVSALGVGAQFGQTGSQSASTTITVVLDPASPDYDAQFRRVSGAWAPSELERIAADPAFVVAGASRTTHDATGQTASVPINIGPVNITLDANQGNYIDETVSTTPEGATTYDGKGGLTSGGGASVNGADIGTQDEDEGIAAKRDADGNVSVVVSDQKRGKVVGPAEAAELKQEATPGIVAESPMDAIDKLLTDAYASVQSLELNGDDVRTLAGWARDRAPWSEAAAYTARAYLAWMDLREALLAPVLDPAIARTNVGAAKQVSWCRAFVDFGKAAGSSGRAIIRRLYDIRAGETAEKFGRWFDWPRSLESERLEFEAIREQAERLPSREIDPLDLITRLDAVQDGIVACSDIDDPVDRMSMIDTVSELRLAIPARAARAFDSDYAENPTAEADRLTGLMTHYKTSEQTLLAELQALLPEAGGDTGIVAWASRVENKYQPLVNLHQLRELLNFWIADIQRLREQYLLLPASHVDLRVSVDSHDPRHPDTEPNAAEYVRMRVAYAARGGDGHEEAISTMLNDLAERMDY